MTNVYQPRLAERDARGNVFSMAHMDVPLTNEETNFGRLSQAELDKDLDAATAQRAADVIDVPPGQQNTHPLTATANRTWAIASRRAQAFWEARRDHFYLEHLHKGYPGMDRAKVAPRGIITMNPYQHGEPAYRLRSEALQHATHWLRRNMGTITAIAPPPPAPTREQIAKARERAIDKLIAEDLRQKGFAIP